ncbi:MAG: MATE family efflux transporter, partial [Paraburkholderia nemoris]
MTQSGITRVAARPPTLTRHAADTARLAAPLAIAQLSQMAMGVTDTILLGSLGPDALAAGGLGANLFFVVVTLLQGVLTSVSVSVSHARGAQDEGRVPHI